MFLKRSVWLIVLCMIAATMGLGLAAEAKTLPKHYLRIGTDPQQLNRPLGTDECVVILADDSPYPVTTRSGSGKPGTGYLRRGEEIVIDSSTHRWKWVQRCGNDALDHPEWEPEGTTICPPEPPAPLTSEETPPVIATPPAPQLPPAELWKQKEKLSIAQQIPTDNAPMTPTISLPPKKKCGKWVAAGIVGGVILGAIIHNNLGNDGDNDRHKKKHCDPETDGIDCDAGENTTGFTIMIPVPLGR